MEYSGGSKLTVTTYLYIMTLIQSVLTNIKKKKNRIENITTWIWTAQIHLYIDFFF